MDCRSVGRSKRLVCSGTIVNVTTRRVMLSRWVRYFGCLATEFVQMGAVLRLFGD